MPAESLRDEKSCGPFVHSSPIKWPFPIPWSIKQVPNNFRENTPEVSVSREWSGYWKASGPLPPGVGGHGKSNGLFFPFIPFWRSKKWTTLEMAVGAFCLWKCRAMNRRHLLRRFSWWLTLQSLVAARWVAPTLGGYETVKFRLELNKKPKVPRIQNMCHLCGYNPNQNSVGRCCDWLVLRWMDGCMWVPPRCGAGPLFASWPLTYAWLSLEVWAVAKVLGFFS